MRRRFPQPRLQRRSVDQNPLKRTDFDDFVACYNAKNRHDRKNPSVSRATRTKELLKRDKLNLDILTPRFPSRRPLGPARLILRSQRIQVWLKDESLQDSANLPDPDVIAQEIVQDLEAALSQFATIAADLKK